MKEKLEKIQRAIFAVMGIIMVILLTADGLGRYVLGKSIVWAGEATRILFVWGCFWAATLAFISKSHIGFDSIANKNRITKAVSGVINGVCLSVIGAVVMLYGMKFVNQVGKYPLPASNLPISVLYSAGIVAGAAWIVIGLYQAFRTIKLSMSKGE
jgi:TRAP-type transport system small permease protein